MQTSSTLRRLCAGVFDYLLKPVTRESLESTLGKASLALQKYYELEEDTSMAGKDSQEIVDYVVLYIRNHYMDDIDFSDISSRMVSALRISQSCSTDTWETHR